MKKKTIHIESRTSLPKMAAGYSVPEGYFESFGERLQKRIEEEKQRQPKVRGIVYYLKPVLGLAAGLAILLSVYLHYPGKVRNQNIEVAVKGEPFQQADPSDQFANTYASTISDVQLISALSEMDDYDASKMSKELLADYLVTDCTDVEILNANK